MHGTSFSIATLVYRYTNNDSFITQIKNCNFDERNVVCYKFSYFFVFIDSNYGELCSIGAPTAFFGRTNYRYFRSQIHYATRRTLHILSNVNHLCLTCFRTTLTSHSYYFRLQQQRNPHKRKASGAF